MSGKKDREQWEVLPKEVESSEPSSRAAVEGDSPAQDRRPEPSGASRQEGPRHEAPPPSEPADLAIRPPADRRRPRRRITAYPVEFVRLDKHSANRENPYAALSPAARHECFIKRLAEIWSGICRRHKDTIQQDMTKILAARKRAA
jgi:hypothetical protein